MDRQALTNQLSELGGHIWRAIHADEDGVTLCKAGAEEKLALDKVNPEDTQLDFNAADWIMGFDTYLETRERQDYLSRRANG